MGADTQHGLLGVRTLRADEDGLYFELADPHADEVVDVLFDGRRIWSLWTVRDSEPAGRGRHVPWPLPLARFLDGRTWLSLVDHVTGRELASAEAAIGSGDQRIAVVDKQGRPLGLDKSLTLSRLFDSRDP